MILKMEIFKKTVWFCLDTANQQAKYALPSNGSTCHLCGGMRLFSGGAILAAARSRSGSDTTPWCHSFPSRRFATPPLQSLCGYCLYGGGRLFFVGDGALDVPLHQTTTTLCGGGRLFVCFRKNLVFLLTFAQRYGMI